MNARTRCQRLHRRFEVFHMVRLALAHARRERCPRVSGMRFERRVLPDACHENAQREDRNERSD